MIKSNYLINFEPKMQKLHNLIDTNTYLGEKFQLGQIKRKIIELTFYFQSALVEASQRLEVEVKKKTLLNTNPSMLGWQITISKN